jgi:3-hydroxyisobutyrate dehydrogenase-like beta-hydroxyacid dehydrogenase
MTDQVIIGILNPGEMGAAVGQCLTSRGHTVLWASAGRSAQTARRAAAAGLTDAGTARQMSGDQAGKIVDLFQGTGLDPRVTAGPATAASAIKMAYAAWTKGSAALLLEARALARAEGVEEALLAEWALSQPQLADQSVQAADSGTTKGWRWIAEMEEIAHCMAEAGLPDGFHQAAAEIYRRFPRRPAEAAAGAEVIHDVLTAITS